MQAISRRQLVLGLIAGVLTLLSWGSWAALSRMALIGPIDFHDITALRFATAGLALLPVFLRLKIDRRGIGGIPWWGVAVLLFGAGAPYSLIVFAGVALAPAGHQALIGPSVIMVLTLIASRYWLGERLDGRQMTGVALVLGGIGMLAWQTLRSGATEASAGHLLFVLAAVLWTAFTVVTRKLRIDAWTATAVVSVLSALVYAPVYLAFAGTRLLDLPPGPVIFQAIYQGLIIGLVALFLYTFTIKSLGAGMAGLFTAAVPPLGNVSAALLLDEPLTAVSVTALALVTAGMAMAILAGALGPGRAAATTGQAGGLVPGSKPPPQATPRE